MNYCTQNPIDPSSGVAAFTPNGRYAVALVGRDDFELYRRHGDAPTLTTDSRASRARGEGGAAMSTLPNKWLRFPCYEIRDGRCSCGKANCESPGKHPRTPNGHKDATNDSFVLWTTEFGRMPCNQGSRGRDHNPFVFINWIAGGGIKGGVTYGASDQWSYKPLDREKPTYCYDVHATILHLLGIDHEQLTFRHNGIERRLTDVHGHVIREILA